MSETVALGEDAIGEHGVGVAVEVTQRAEALHERDATRVRVGDAVGTCSSPLPGEQLGQEHTECSAQQFAVSGEQKPHSTRQRTVANLYQVSFVVTFASLLSG